MQQPDGLARPASGQSRIGVVGLLLITILALFIKPDRALTKNCRALLSAFTEACQGLRHA
ncbi:hypothetical protein [Streptomyces sp. NPDC060010]|uniref:hypothetical protein n=1 Tax=Streptomyces sp. NPDC060010 TaxID=3347036 RepID=UPI00368A134F